MRKKFNISGACFEQKHYMMDNTHKIKDVMALVEDGEYFVINRPRQYGKTTLILSLIDTLNKDDNYLPIQLDLQDIDEKEQTIDKSFSKAFMAIFAQLLTDQNPELHDFIQQQKETVISTPSLSNAIT